MEPQHQVAVVPLRRLAYFTMSNIIVDMTITAITTTNTNIIIISNSNNSNNSSLYNFSSNSSSTIIIITTNSDEAQRFMFLPNPALYCPMIPRNPVSSSLLTNDA